MVRSFICARSVARAVRNTTIRFFKESSSDMEIWIIFRVDVGIIIENENSMLSLFDDIELRLYTGKRKKLGGIQRDFHEKCVYT